MLFQRRVAPSFEVHVIDRVFGETVGKLVPLSIHMKPHSIYGFCNKQYTIRQEYACKALIEHMYFSIRSLVIICDHPSLFVNHRRASRR
jgi:hypothetical protein